MKTANMTGPAPRLQSPAFLPKAIFDFAKGVGVFAVFGVGISVVSAAFALYIANSIFSLGWLVACGPTEPLCPHFRARPHAAGLVQAATPQPRGPAPDASGWTVNDGAPINIAMYAAFAEVRRLSPGAHHFLDDPCGLHAQLRRKKYPAWLLAAGLVFWF